MAVFLPLYKYNAEKSTYIQHNTMQMLHELHCLILRLNGKAELYGMLLLYACILRGIHPV